MHNRRYQMQCGSIVRQRGVAVVTALLLTTLSVTIVASLFWQQHVQVRSIENQQLQLRQQWILRGTLDWARLLLREDTTSSHADHLGETWAGPLAATGLDAYLEQEKGSQGSGQARLSGSIIDAQSRFNLRNLAPDGTVDVHEVAALQRLLLALRLDPQLARRTADLIASSAANPGTAAEQTATRRPGGGVASGARQIGIDQIDDLLAIAGMRPEVLARLQEYIVLLPIATPINVNTASVPVLTARLAGWSAEEIALLVAGRERAYIRDDGDLALRLQGKLTLPLEKHVSISSNYFLVNGKISLPKGSMQMQALLERHFMTGSRLVWVREH